MADDNAEVATKYCSTWYVMNISFICRYRRCAILIIQSHVIVDIVFARWLQFICCAR
jgi:hypothetical protein